ncbi:MAG: hypothetical protein NT165_02565 [Candidatus Falkowbacteria bacterium]|nr:hypothetical protein [Candidatus Falkowbacteria bacterium]
MKQINQKMKDDNVITPYAEILKKRTDNANPSSKYKMIYDFPTYGSGVVQDAKQQ